MESTGSRLKKLRQEKGISLEEVHKKTNIHLDILKSIEEDSLVNLNPVYIKGFLKIYCRFLGVDPQDYLAGCREDKAANTVYHLSERKDRSSRQAQSQNSLLKSKITALAVTAAALLFLTLGAVKLVKSISRSGSKKSKTQLALPRPKAVKRDEKKVVARPKPGALKAQPQPKTEAVNSSSLSGEAGELNQQSGVRVGLQALDDCWVQAKLDGKTVFQNILRKGRFESWGAKDKIELSLGSAGGVRLEVNGRLIPSLGRKGQVLKNILITKDGLKVGK